MIPVSITRGGKTCSGTYSVANCVLAISYAGQTKRTQIGGMDAVTLAEMILGKMIGTGAA